MFHFNIVLEQWHNNKIWPLVVYSHLWLTILPVFLTGTTKILCLLFLGEKVRWVGEKKEMERECWKGLLRILKITENTFLRFKLQNYVTK